MKQLDPRAIAPGGDGQVLTTVAGVAAWDEAAASGITVQDEDANVGTEITQLDFQGVGVTVTAGDAGEAIVTVSSAGGEMIGAKVGRGSSQSIADSTYTAVSFTATDYDTGSPNLFDSGSPTKLTIPSFGWWRVCGGVSFIADDVGSRSIRLHKNGIAVSDVEFGQASEMTAGAPSLLTAAFDDLFLEGDELELMAFQSSGEAAFIGAASFSVHCINPGNAAPGTLAVHDEGVNVGTEITQIDFQGGGVSVADGGTDEVVVTVPLQVLLLESGGTVPVGTPTGCIIFEKA